MDIISQVIEEQREYFSVTGMGITGWNPPSSHRTIRRGSI